MRNWYWMRFNEHSALAGKHAFLSASNYHWIRYDMDRLAEVFRNSQAAKRGTELHAFAHEAIRLRIRLPRNGKTVNQYVNDCIGFRMTNEQALVYSDNCYGTPDAIRFHENKLQIFDLKTGQKDASFDQLKIYVALFCLEYGYKPHEIDIELRIYQHDEVEFYIPEVPEIAEIMSKIVVFDRAIEEMKEA
jgi:hypothetical protein